ASFSRDWSSDVCSSDLHVALRCPPSRPPRAVRGPDRRHRAREAPEALAPRLEDRADRERKPGLARLVRNHQRIMRKAPVATPLAIVVGPGSAGASPPWPG